MAKKTKATPKRKTKAAGARKKPTSARKPAAKPAAQPRSAAPPAADQPAPEPAAAKPAAPPSPPPGTTRAGDAKTGGGARAFAVFVFVAVIAAGGFLTWPQWAPALKQRLAEAPPPGTAAVPAPVPAPAPAGAETPAGDDAALEKLRAERAQLQAELSRLMARIETVETAVDTVKKMVRATVPPSEKIAAGSSVEELTARLDELEKEGGTLKGLAQRVDQLEKSGAPSAAVPAADGPGNARARAIVLAVANLRQVIATDRPFDKAMQSLTAVAGEDPEVKVAVAVLSKSAATGLPTLAALRRRFERLAGKIVQASKAPQGRGWMERAASRISSLVTWRRIDEGDGETVDALVARAENRLAQGDLPGAIEAVEGLGGMKKAAAVAGSWLADAKARLAAEQAISTLHVHAVSLLAPAEG